MRIRRWWMWTGLALCCLSLPARAEEAKTAGEPTGAATGAATRTSAEMAHPFAGPVFTGFVEESCRVTKLMSVADFYAWMDGPFLQAARSEPAGRAGDSWAEVLAAQRSALLREEDAGTRSRMELALGTWLHATVKKALPNYNLDRGFELSDAARRAERQCMLQSILISSLLQAMGVDAGIAMVNRNREGTYTNNDHVVVMLKLSNGRDVLVDASYGETLVAHHGLMALLPGTGYRYVRPVYTPDFREITGYREVASGRTLTRDAVRPMDANFIRSHFDYFRGERVPGGVLARNPSEGGLRQSAEYYKASLATCPNNPLPAYMLGKVYEKQGLLPAAQQQYRRARAIYRLAGWTPDELTRAIGRTRD